MNPKSSSGLALVGLIGAMLVMGLLIAGLLVLINTGLLETVETSGSSAAFFSAESGVSMAKAYIATNSAWYTNVPYTITGSIGRATYSTVVTTSTVSAVPPVAFITSTGRLDDAQWTSIYGVIPTQGVMRAIIVYRQQGEDEPRYRTCDSNFKLSNETNALSADNNPQWQRIVASPLTNEFLLITQNSTRWIWGQVYTNGVWRRVRLGQAPNNNARAYDVAYENLSGRGMVVYSRTNAPQYRIWDGSSLTPERAINVDATDDIRWIRLVPQPGSNRMMLLARWRSLPPGPQRNYSSAIIWNGATWTNLQPLEVQCKSEIAYETMDAAWSTNSAMVVYINGNTANEREKPKYQTYTPAGGWSGESEMTSLGGQPRWMRVEFSPDGTYAFAGFLYVQGGAARLKGAYWNGSTWGSYIGGVQLDVSNKRDFDIAWSSQTNTLMVTYCQRNQDTHSYMFQTNAPAGSPINGNMATGTDDGRWCVLQPDPFSGEFLYISLDDQKDVNVQRWTGTSWVLLGEVEDDSNDSYNSIGISFRRDVVP